MLHRRLEEIGPDDLALYGGRAYHLAEARRLGCPVPDAMVLSTQLYTRFLEQGGLDGEILSILSTMQPSAMHQFRAVEWAINSAFAVRRLPKSVREAILDLAPLLDDGPVVVRSSATTESGSAHSFVGQHSSYTDIHTPEELVQAVVDCWQSMYSARALHYAHHFGVNLSRSAMAVMVQRQVEIVSKGALFTVNPISGNPDEFVMQSLEDGASTVRTLNPYDPSSCESFLERQMLRYGLLLDEHLKQYQVVEWTADASQIWILGVRPITGVPPYLPARPDAHEAVAQWNLVNPHGWDGRELPPYSWYHRSRARDIRYALEEGLSRQQVRAADDRFLRGYRYLPANAAKRAQGSSRISRSVPAVVRQLAMTTRTERDYVSQRHLHDPILDEVWNRDWTLLENRELGEQLHKAVFLSHAYISAGSFISTDTAMIRNLFMRVHTEWIGGDINPQELVASPSRSMLELDRKAAALCARTDDDEDLDRLLVESFWDKRYLMIDPALIEQTWDIALLHPDWVGFKQRIQAYARSGDHTPEAIKKDSERRQKQKKTALTRVRGLQKLLYDRLLNRTQSLLRLDASRLEPAACSMLVEHEILEEVGTRLARKGLARNRQEAALLEYREVQDWLRGRLGAEVKDRIADRRELYRQWWRYRPPQVLVIEPAHEAVSEDAEESAPGVAGLAVSPGEAMGRVRVLHGPGEGTSLLAGEVLVVDDPLSEYSPLFSIASAIISRQGSLLDHAATLAREYGVPAVFSLPNATTVFKTGDIVHVNAHDGIVTSQHRAVSWDS